MSSDPRTFTSRLSLAALVVANLLVTVQALRWNWGYYQLFLVYWLEALVIGGYNVLRLLVVGFVGKEPFGAWASRNVSASPAARIGLTLLGTGFFVFKFGALALATGFWLAMLPAFLDTAHRPPSDPVLEGLGRAGEGAGWAVAFLVTSHGASFVWNFLWRREFETQSVFGLVFWPYLRMGLALVVLVGGLLVIKLAPALGSTTLLIVALMLLKTLADAWTHRREHRHPPTAGAGVPAAGARDTC